VAVENVDIVAWWGAVVATIVGAVQVYDRLFHKPPPTVTYLMSGSEEVGNHVTIINASNVPIIITAWELYWGKVKRFGMERGTSIAEADFEDVTVLTLAPYGHKTWSFTEENHFAWGYKMAKRGHLYIELNVVGRRRPVVLHVYNPAPGSYQEPRSLRRLLPHSLRPKPKLMVG
tara:strand:- start:512 stop:1033 length:522 start_codon:yes stop_codon:yes gene_type:complete